MIYNRKSMFGSFCRSKRLLFLTGYTSLFAATTPSYKLSISILIFFCSIKFFAYLLSIVPSTGFLLGSAIFTYFKIIDFSLPRVPRNFVNSSWVLRGFDVSYKFFRRVFMALAFPFWWRLLKRGKRINRSPETTKYF